MKKILVNDTMQSSYTYNLTEPEGQSFHPEFNSNPRDGHALFSGFVKAAWDNQKNSKKA